MSAPNPTVCLPTLTSSSLRAVNTLNPANSYIKTVRHTAAHDFDLSVALCPGEAVIILALSVEFIDVLKVASVPWIPVAKLVRVCKGRYQRLGKEKKGDKSSGWLAVAASWAVSFQTDTGTLMDGGRGSGYVLVRRGRKQPLS